MVVGKKGNNKDFLQLILGPVFLFNAIIFFFQALTKNLYPPLLVPLREAFLIDNARARLLITLVFLAIPCPVRTGFYLDLAIIILISLNLSSVKS